MEKTKKQKKLTSLWIVLFTAAGAAACDGTGAGEPLGTVRSALDSCVRGTPSVTDIREETPGPVAPGITKVYFVTVRNNDSATCGPGSLSFVPSSEHLFTINSTPSNPVDGVGPGSTVQFRVTAASDPIVAPGTYSLPFTVIESPQFTTTTGALTYVATFDNPTGCNRQRLAVAIDNPNPPPVPVGAPQSYHITVRNVDNAQCGQDTFRLSPCSLHFFNISNDGPFVIFPQGSAVFTLTLQGPDFFTPGSSASECFNVFGDHHVTPDLSGSGTVTYRN